ncbi:MAG: PAS domain S-box protein [Thermodesulfobacteriota bacterium]
MAITEKPAAHGQPAEIRIQREECYRVLFENANDAIFILKDDVFIDCNAKTCEMFGCTRVEILGSMPYRFSPPFQPDGVDSTIKAREKIQAAFAGTPQFFQWLHTRLDGTPFHAEVSLNTVTISEQVYLQAIVRDITKRKETEEALSQSRSRLQALIDASLDAITITDENGIFLASNTALQKRWGRTREEIVGHSAAEVLTPEIFSNRLERVRQCISTGKSDHFIDQRGKDCFENTIVPIVEAEGRIRTVAMFSRDVTEWKRTEKALQESARKIRAIFNVSFSFIGLLDIDGVLLEANQTALDFIGAGLPDVAGKRFWETPWWNHSRAMQEMCKFAVKRAAAGETVRFEATHMAADGSLHTIDFSLKPITDDAGNIALLIPEGRDITEQKLSEARTRERESMISALVETSRDWIWAMDLNGTHTYSNPAVKEILGYDAHEIVGRQLELVHPDDLDIVRNSIPGWIERKCGWSNLPIRFRHKDGSWRHLESSAVPILDAAGEMIGFRGVDRDITERKRVENELVSLTQRLNDIIEFIPDATFVIDQNKRIIAWNKATEEMTGVEKERMLGKGDYEYAIPFFGERKPILIDFLDVPDEQIEACYKYVTRQEGKIVAESYIPTLNRGRGAHLWGVAAPLFDKDGNRFGSIEVIRDVTANVRKEQERLRAEARYREILEEIDDGYYEVDLGGTFTFFNNAMSRILRYPPDEMKNLNNRTFMDEVTARKVFVTFNQVFTTGRPAKACDWELIRKDGTRCVLETSVSLINDDKGKPVGFRGIARDISDQKALQQQFFQAQKMESIGRLTGGIAHDFNNLLSVIIGRAELALMKLHPSDPLYKDLASIKAVGQRSADLTRQLLAFARKQTITPKVLNLNSVIDSMIKVLKQLIGEDVELLWKPSADLWLVKMDPAQVDQILANLLVNARDAIQDVGRVTIETANVVLGEPFCEARVGFIPGQYVRLTVNDTGSGMDSETLLHIFEPFFSTKPVGKGTGLGLATVYGIVKQNNGFIDVESEPGGGTTFRIYQPRFVGKDTLAQAEFMKPKVIKGAETILLVEDEPEILDVVRTILQNLGYNLVTAASPVEAIHLAAEHDGEIHLLITDVIMPEMNGRDLAKRLLALYPNLKCLFMSGYTADVIAHHGVLDEGVHFIQKPFRIDELAEKVRSAMAPN